MNCAAPKNLKEAPKRGQAPARRSLFGCALKDIQANKDKYLPQPNYEQNEQNMDTYGSQKPVPYGCDGTRPVHQKNLWNGKHSRVTTPEAAKAEPSEQNANTHGSQKCIPYSVFQKSIPYSHGVTKSSYQKNAWERRSGSAPIREMKTRFRDQRPNSHIATGSNFNQRGSSKNRHTGYSSSDSSVSSLPLQNTYSSCSDSFSNESFNMSGDNSSSVPNEKFNPSFLNRSVSYDLSTQSFRCTVTNTPSVHLSRSNENILCSQLNGKKHQLQELPPPNNCSNNPRKCGNLGVTNSCDSNYANSGSNYVHIPQNQLSESHINLPNFSVASGNTGIIPPPMPPNRSGFDDSPSGLSLCHSDLFYQQQNQSITDCSTVSPTELCRDTTTIPVCSTTYFSSSSSDPSLRTDTVLEEQTSEIKSLNINDSCAISVEDSDSEEGESSSISDSVISNSNPTTEQFQAITQLLLGIESERTFPEYDHARTVVENLKKVVKIYIRGVWLEPYGSYVSGFAIGSSDINVAIIPEKHISSSHRTLQEMIKPIQKEMRNCEPVYEGNQDYRTALLVFCEPHRHLSCKIRILGNKQFCYTAQLLKQFGELDSRVKTLVIAVRHWAQVCDVVYDEDNGRLIPLGYVLMMIHFLQQTDPPVLPIPNMESRGKMEVLKEENVQSVGELWLDFFKYYAETFNWKDNVVSIISKKPVLKASKSWGKCWIAIEEPYDKYVNVAKSVLSLDMSNYIQMCFLNTYTYFLNPTVSSNGQSDDTASNSKELHVGSNDENVTKYNYDFYQNNFLNGLSVPVICSTCEHLGHLCNECIHAENTVLVSLPKMTPVFLLTIEKALQSLYIEYSLSINGVKERVHLVENLQRHLRKKFPKARVDLIGSSRNGFGLTDSDVDVCLTLENESAENINAKKLVKSVSRVLRRIPDFTDVIYITMSKIPLVKFIDRKTKLRCDISIYNELAIYNTDLLRAYSKIDQRVEILGCAMKLLAKKACIDDTAQRTLSSYSYVLMVLYFLQHVEPPVIPVLQELYDKSGPMPTHIVENENVWFFEDIKNLNSVWDGKGKNERNVGELWIELLEFYTGKFDFSQFICIAQKSPVMESQNVSSSMLFNIQDPFIKDLNLGSRLSGTMSRRTLKTLQRARVLFGTPIASEKPPSGFQSFKDYLFSPMNLTDGRVMVINECELCGKLGHKENACKRYRLNSSKFWNRPPMKTANRR